MEVGRWNSTDSEVSLHFGSVNFSLQMHKEYPHWRAGGEPNWKAKRIKMYANNLFWPHGGIRS